MSSDLQQLLASHDTSTTNLLLLRGGGSIHEASTAALALNLGREGWKLQSMGTYSTITALVMNASLRLYTSQKFTTPPRHENARLVRILESIFTASTVLCIVSGTFTAVLFNILGIYSKEALGMGNEVGYAAFTKATALYRKWGFRAFLTTCLCFVTTFLTSVYEKTLSHHHHDKSLSPRDWVGQGILVVSIFLAIMGTVHIQKVLAMATRYIYTPEACAANHIA